MAITYPLTPPASVPAEITLSPLAVVGVSASPFTLEQEVFEHQGQAWQMEVSLPPMARPEAEEWVAFLLSLNGRAGTFLMGDPVGAAPRGTALGTPLVDGAGQQRAKTLATKGWTADAAGVLLPGDYIQIGAGAAARLYKNLTAVNADAAGEATLDVWPRIRDSLADGAAIVTAATAGVWRMASNQMTWTVGEAQVYGISFACVEAL